MFILGLSKFGELYDLAGLIAPRPILFEAGTYIVDSTQVLVALLRKKWSQCETTWHFYSLLSVSEDHPPIQSFSKDDAVNLPNNML